MEHIANGDPFESGSSRPLDFGHWAAHKLEQLSSYRIRHGEAVATGIALDVTISYLKGMIAEEEWKKIISLILLLGFEIYVTEFSSTDEKGVPLLINGLNEFREHLGGRLTIMLLEKIGKGKEVHELQEDLVIKAIAVLKEMQEERSRILTEVR
jgi:3-dehydroquinate synthase